MKNGFKVARIALSAAMLTSIGVSASAYVAKEKATVDTLATISEGMRDYMLDHQDGHGTGAYPPVAPPASLQALGERDQRGIALKEHVIAAEVESTRSARLCAVSWSISMMLISLAALVLAFDGIRDIRGGVIGKTKTARTNA